MRLFIDTWGWLTLEDEAEKFHSAAENCFKERATLTGKLVTSDYVLDETLSRLFSRRPFAEAWRYTQAILDAAPAGHLVIERVTEDRFLNALELRRRLRDKPRISFTDLTSAVIMSELRITDVLTGDDHFRQVGMGFRVLPE